MESAPNDLARPTSFITIAWNWSRKYLSEISFHSFCKHSGGKQFWVAKDRISVRRLWSGEGCCKTDIAGFSRRHMSCDKGDNRSLTRPSRSWRSWVDAFVGWYKPHTDVFRRNRGRSIRQKGFSWRLNGSGLAKDDVTCLFLVRSDRIRNTDVVVLHRLVDKVIKTCTRSLHRHGHDVTTKYPSNNEMNWRWSCFIALRSDCLSIGMNVRGRDAQPTRRSCRQFWTSSFFKYCFWFSGSFEWLDSKTWSSERVGQGRVERLRRQCQQGRIERWSFGRR